MSWDASAPAQVSALRSQLNACAAWTAASGLLAQIHYPDLDASGSVTLPAAVIAHQSAAGRRAFLGVDVLPSGTLEIVLFSSTGIGALETLARSIGQQICTDTGLIGLEVEDITEAIESERAEVVSSAAQVYEIAITLSYGLRE